MILEEGNYVVELELDSTFLENSTDNVKHYDKVHFEPSEYVFSTKIGLRVFEEEILIRSAIVGSIGGGTGVHQNSQLIEKDKILVCCSDSIFCLSLPQLDLIWKTSADEATCFGIYKHAENYIVHGEMSISSLDANGKILWQKFGGEIFVSLKGEKEIEITETYIKATDWENRVYKFDFNGVEIK